MSNCANSDRPNRKGFPGGFTLLEVLIAFTIMAVALVALLQAFSTGLASTSAAEARSHLVQRAQSRLADVGAGIPLEPGVHTGHEDGFDWRADIQPFPPEAQGQEPQSLGPKLFRVEVTVIAPDGRRQGLTTLRMGEVR
ncbi:type IV pilus modification PilV family protein [Ferruginivarius sediminum]|uniref:Type II secretion system protein n=1 Tax=Ferruginivarius sediminum TaxID=2661937 RepID=A0A369TCK4_9PROT|nr:type II secretion system protein [Ferruginivarius sediminum]RDD63063.1 type II secretion system protein [Ferruginivarius sediminum]